MTPGELCAAYRTELERPYGKERADKSIVDYHRGWFSIGLPTIYPDNSIGNARFHVMSKRRKEVEGMLANLKKRLP